jgi:triphosphoribosyl-dephospho-CoA synthetase
MSWLNLVGQIFQPAADLIDNLHTSDDEKAEAQRKLQEIINSAEQRVMEHAEKFESEVTQRHANDMKSDSWLSKNIRPLTLMVTMATIYILVYATTFKSLSDGQVSVLQAWIPMLTGLFGTMVVFYFGSRGIEKIQKIKK